METVNHGATLRKDLAEPLASVCVSSNIRVQNTNGASLDLLRLRSAGNDPIVRLYVNSTGRLFVRQDFLPTAQKDSGANLQSGWNAVELCGTVGTGTTWDLYLNGAKVVNAWAADTGSAPVGRIQIGDPGAKTISANWDDVVVDTVPD